MPIVPEGIYLEIKKQTIGTAGTARTQEMRSYYQVHSIDEDLVEVQILDMNDQLLPYKEEVAVEDFLKRFTFQPNYLANKKSPETKAVDKAIAQAEVHYQRQEYYSAEYEYGKALKLDQKNVRANFGIGKVYLALGQSDKAVETFKRLTSLDAVFAVENKHIFNELGIELRRLHLYDQAIEHYLKALSFTKDDENLLFNVARAYYEKKDARNAVAYLKRALALNPSMVQALTLMAEIKAAWERQRRKA